MKNKTTINNIGEIEIIKIIDNLIFEKTGKKLIRDDSFFFTFNKKSFNSDDLEPQIVFNTDMLVSTTDVPAHMSYYQIGRKSVLMNLSDLIVKGVKPMGILISLGLNKNMKLEHFKELMIGIIEYSNNCNIDYLGGDVNETKELIINPTVFGFQEHSKIIFRNGLKPGDFIVANGKFGLTGVGFDILLNKKGNIEDYPLYERSIMSVLEPNDLGREAFVLSQNRLATSSIDSSDGLAKSLMDLIISNLNMEVGFEIDFNNNLFDREALKYSEDYDISLEDLVFNGGEEFIHLFTIDPNNLEDAQKAIKHKGGQIHKIGKVISEKKINFLKDGKKFELNRSGFEHFS